MNVLTDKFSFSDGFVFIDSKQSKIDWDEMDLQLFDGTTTIKPNIDPNTDIESVKSALGITNQTAEFADGATLSSDEWSKVTASDLNGNLEIWLSNDASTVQTADFSKNTGVKEIHLYDGAQDVKFNSTVSGNVADVSSLASGEKNVTLGGGDLVVVAMPSGEGKVNVTGGTGADSIVVQGGAPVTFDMSGGGADKVITMAEANARVTLENYSTDAAIVVQDTYAGDLVGAVSKNNITFQDGTVVLNASGSSANSKINLGESDTNGWIVNLENPSDDAGKKSQLVGFAGKDGGIVDGSELKDVLFVGNRDGSAEGAQMIGGEGNDTFLGGAGDRIVTGKGKDVVNLGSNSSATRDGATVNVTSGRVTITGAHNNLSDFAGDTLSVDNLDISKMKFSFAGGSLIMKGTNDDGESIYTEVQGVSTTGAGYVTQYIQNGEDTTYRVAIGAESSTIDVKENEDERAYAYIGNNSALDFSNYTKDAFVDLTGSYGSYIDNTAAYFEGINKFVGGEGDFVVMGSEGKETITAGKGNGSLYGGGGINVLNGYIGSDKEGSSTFFVFGGNDGAVNTINNFEFVESNNYVNAANVTADELNTDIANNRFSGVAVVNNDLLVEVTSNSTGETEKALIKGAKDTVTGYGEDFAVNGLVAQVGDTKVNVDGTAEYYLATETNARVDITDAAGTNVAVWLGDDGRDLQFEGDFAVIDASNYSGKAELAGNSLDNTITAGSGNTSLWGGNGGNDLLIGGTGTDNYYYAAGDGNDTISGNTSGDTVNFLNISLADISIDTITSSAVVLRFTDGNSLTVTDAGNVNYKVGGATYGLNSERTDLVQK